MIRRVKQTSRTSSCGTTTHTATIVRTIACQLNAQHACTGPGRLAELSQSRVWLPQPSEAAIHGGTADSPLPEPTSRNIWPEFGRVIPGQGCPPEEKKEQKSDEQGEALLSRTKRRRRPSPTLASDTSRIADSSCSCCDR